MPLSIRFVKGDGAWKIYAIQKPRSGIQEESADLQLPSESEQVALVRESMHVFAVSINEKSVEKLHGHASSLWQRQRSVEELDKIFGAFFEVGADLTVLDDYSPLFDSSPSFDDNGVLVIKGYYDTEPNQLHFEQSYFFEGLRWKLIGFSASIS